MKTRKEATEATLGNALPGVYLAQLNTIKTLASEGRFTFTLHTGDMARLLHDQEVLGSIGLRSEIVTEDDSPALKVHWDKLPSDSGEMMSPLHKELYERATFQQLYTSDKGELLRRIDREINTATAFGKYQVVIPLTEEERNYQLSYTIRALKFLGYNPGYQPWNATEIHLDWGL